ncbi:response regulator [Haloplanus pelagicus]|jgi:DNA-binding response OmpR family regulator|uniref:response regulator n=1 Tax=Haloplanus pelagicus TaxID=2949995 RepID=UPI00203D9DCA|nr:response regulator [Haloplanus sp. HW8-1]
MTATPRVLVADDELALLDLYATWLDDVDVDLVRAHCGAEALSYCEDGEVDVAILDRHMPRVSGDEVLDSLRECPAGPRVAFVTAATPDVRIVDLDIDAYLTKPVERAKFVDLVHSLVHRETLPETVDRYVEKLSKRAALLESESQSVLRADPVYSRLESELSRLASRIDDYCLEDPYLCRTLTDGDGAGIGATFDPLA